MRGMLRVAVSDLKEGLVLLAEDASRYVTRVRRKKVGDTILLFDPIVGTCAGAEIVEAGSSGLRVEVEAPRLAPTDNMPVFLLQGVGKADKPEQCVRDVTALGAEGVAFVTCERSVARSKALGRKERLQRVSAQVARQCERGDLPSLIGPISFLEAITKKDWWTKEITHRWVCAWHDSAVPLIELALAVDWGREGVVLLIGPEGGLSEDELSEALSQNFVPVTLGPYVLRTETACTTSLSLLRGVAVASVASGPTSVE